MNVTWSHTTCLDGNNATYVYIMYIEDWNNDKNADWNIHGVHGHERQTVINFLNPGSTYKAYMVQANQYGNGPPSTRFYMKTIASRNNKLLFFVAAVMKVIHSTVKSKLRAKSINFGWIRSSRSQMFFKRVVHKNLATLTGKHRCWSLFSIRLSLIRTSTQVFSFEYFEIFNSSIFHKTPPVAASNEWMGWTWHFLLTNGIALKQTSFLSSNESFPDREKAKIGFHSFH